MKNKGFTLVELLAVIAIMALLAGIAIPKILSMLDKGKEEDYIKDAKAVLAQAKEVYYSERTRDIFKEDKVTHTGCYVTEVANLDFSTTTSAYGDNYDKSNSWVWYCPITNVWGISLKTGYTKTRDATYRADTNYYSYVSNEYKLLEKGVDYNIGDDIVGTVYVPVRGKCLQCDNPGDNHACDCFGTKDKPLENRLSTDAKIIDSPANA